MKIPRALAVFLCSAGAILALAIIKALVVSGLDTLPPAKILVFGSVTFGLIAALVDWGLLRDLFPGAKSKAQSALDGHSQKAPTTGPLQERARLRPIVFREICPPPATPGLSFYGGIPVGPATLVWPKVVNKPGGAPLSFIMQWDAAELAPQDATGLLPRDGALYLFADLTWGDPFDFQFIHAPGPVRDWQALPAPPDLPPIYGDDGAYKVPYCSPRIAKESQDVPRLLPKWNFAPIAFAYPVPPSEEDRYWEDSNSTAEALLLLEHPVGVPPARRLDVRPPRFARPFAAFPHDHAAVRVVAAKVLDQLRHPERLLLQATADDRHAQFEVWRNEATRRYVSAATHRPGASVDEALADEIWHWMEGLEPVLASSWGALIEACANVSLGLESEAAGSLPADLVARCTEHHRLATAYLHYEYPNHRNPDALTNWEARKAEGALQEIRSLLAPCPNHMFGPPSCVQGAVEEYLEKWVLLLELSSRGPIGHEFGEGVLQFLIRPFDLREGRFDRVKLVASAY